MNNDNLLKDKDSKKDNESDDDDIDTGFGNKKKDKPLDESKQSAQDDATEELTAE